ncbi:MAG TPA: HAD-IIIA family hydrolase [Gemmatimonadaceae bacterium]|nr:HAD-IIIA family hydrolase [Gemmatimonadaceae bacterium]
MSDRAVLLDKDGTLVHNVPGARDPAAFELMPLVGETLARLSNAGFRLAVVSNQPGVALGCFTAADLERTERRLRECLGLPIERFFYCPHAPDEGCACRKPAPGLLQHAMRALDAAPETTWFVGDILDDIEAAHRAGCRAILFDSGGETEWEWSPLRAPDHVVRRFDRVADLILGS